MEIQVQEKLTGRALRDRILAKYGSKEKLQRLAKRKDLAARLALADLAILEEDPRQLDQEQVTTVIAEFDDDDLSRLTKERLRVLHFLEKKGPSNLGQLVAALGRDKKNVSTDLRILEGFGLVRIERLGREIRTSLAGTRILIQFGSGGLT